MIQVTTTANGAERSSPKYSVSPRYPHVGDRDGERQRRRDSAVSRDAGARYDGFDGSLGLGHRLHAERDFGDT